MELILLMPRTDVQGSNTLLSVYGCSWIALVGLIFLFKICTFSQKILVNFQLIFHFVQGVTFMLALAGITDVVVYTGLIVTDVFACTLAFVPIGWGLLSICVAWNPVLKRVGLWKSVRSLGLLYDADLHLYCRMFVVPIHLNVPNMPNVQPSVQPRFGNLPHPCWKQPKFWVIGVILAFVHADYLT